MTMPLLFTVNTVPVHGTIGRGVVTLMTDDLAKMLRVLTSHEWVFHDEAERSSVRIGFQAPQCKKEQSNE